MVRDALGRPLAAVPVGVLHRPPLPGHTARTDARGRFELGPLPAGRYAISAPLGDGWDGWTGPACSDLPDAAIASSGGALVPHVTVSAAAPRAEIALTLFRSAHVSGVVTANGRPTGGVGLRLWQSPRRLSLDTFADDLGRFAFDDVLPGDWELRVIDLAGLQERRFARPPPQQVRLAEGARATGLAVELLPADARILGRVVDETGAPIADLPVDCYPAGADLAAAVDRTRTAADGTFALEPLPALPLRVQVHAGDEGTDVATRALASIPAPIDVDLRREPSVDLGTLELRRNRAAILDITLQRTAPAPDVSRLRAVLARGTHTADAMLHAFETDGFAATNAARELTITRLTADRGALHVAFHEPLVEHTLLVHSVDRAHPLAFVEHVRPTAGRTERTLHY